MKDGIPTWEERVYTEFFAPDVRLEKGMLYAIQFIWIGNCCHVHQRIRLHEPYFDEDIFVADHGYVNGVEYGAMVYKDSIDAGQISWIQAARMLYHMVGIPKKSDRKKFVELVKAL